jgi:hypothetical protein
MTREELIEKINECANMFDEIYKRGILSVTNHEIHCTDEAFLELADGHELTIVDRGRGKYPYKIQTKIGELTLFSIGTEEDVERIKNELQLE